MARKETFTVEQVRAALEASGGIQSDAAAKLGCSHSTVGRYIQRSAELRDALTEICDPNLDIAETQLLAAVRRGEAWAVCFYLKCKGKARGWSERVAVSNPDGSNLVPPHSRVVFYIPDNGRGPIV